MKGVRTFRHGKQNYLEVENEMEIEEFPIQSSSGSLIRGGLRMVCQRTQSFLLLKIISGAPK